MSPALLITGGGTGGHVSPGLGVAREWQARHGKKSVAWVGRPASLEKRMVEREGLPFLELPARALQRKQWWKNLFLPWRLYQGVAAGRALLAGRSTGAVLMTGGFVGMPLSLAAALEKWPLVLMEPNAVAGVANRALGPLARALCMAYPSDRPGKKEHLTGTPCRLNGFPSKASALRSLGLKSGRKTLLVMPGSQAAESINAALRGALPKLADRAGRWQVLWMCGTKNEKAVRAFAKNLKLPVRAVGFIDDVASAYAAADLLLCRSGASTLAELAMAGKPSMQVPYPHATGDHQRANAMAFARHGAAEVLDESALDAVGLEARLRALLDAPATLAGMAKAAKKLAKPKAAAAVADILEYACSTR